MTTNRVINVWAKDPDFSPLDGADPNVRTIIIGESPTNASADVTVVLSLPLFEADFRNLTHLYLWSTSGLETVSGLSAKQQVLEIRKSADLKSIDTLPVTLTTLILEDCPKLNAVPSLNGKQYPHLVGISLAGCGAIDAAWINQLVSHAPNLQRLDLSRCTQVTLLPAQLPRRLDRLDLNDCTALVSLPDTLPRTLQRLGLSRATCLGKAEHWVFPDLPGSLDYLDLTQTTSLTRLPTFPKAEQPKDKAEQPKPRTLFLYGSAVLEPPASEHGSSAEINVAVDTREYQDEVDLVDRGKVRRCKLLLLGNGKAGKTKLALNLNPHFNRADKEQGGDYNGTTHGVQFWDWADFEAATQDKNRQVNLHIWDFGGQEIYHSTHRIFVGRGSVFCVLWNPDQDGREAPFEHGYQDTWYPVRYWLDYIHMECPHNRPPIAIVCSHQGNNWQQGNDAANTALKTQLQARLTKIIGDEYAKRIPLFVLDSELDLGERTDLEKWLKKSVLTVVDTQGTVVPTYWEIAQNMVEEWLPDARQDQDVDEDRDGTDPTAHRRLTIPQFKDHLHEAITQQLRTPDVTETNFDKLRQNYQNRDFLTERRVQRTLRFLTHSGWLYWNPTLFQSRVIIDQPWALKTVYAVLDRRQNSAVYKKLAAAGGRFTFKDLQEWCSKHEPLEEDDQKLIMSFMTSVGVCFAIKHDYSSSETVYISPTHLPESDGLIAEFDLQHLDQTQDEVESPQLHRGHWFAILRELCQPYGTNGTWTKNACLVSGSSYRPNQEEKPWQVLLRFELDDERKGLGGKIYLSAVGDGVAENLPTLKRFVQSFLPGFDGKASDAVSELDRTFPPCLESAKSVFFSYAWNPVDAKGDYEEPVNVVFDALKPLADRGMVKLLRDNVSMQPTEYITEFITQAGSQNVDLVLVFTSEKYWRSWWCMLELSSLIESLKKSNKGVDKSVLVIEHESGRKWTAGDVTRIVEHWKNLELVGPDHEKVPKDMPEQLMDYNWQRLVRRFINVIETDSTPLSSNAPQIRRVWSRDASTEIITWVKQKLGLPTNSGEP